MKRRRWLLIGFAAVALGAAAVALLRPRPPEEFPLVELVPDDAILYAGFPDYRRIEALETPWKDEIRRRLDPARPHLAGPVAVYLDREFQWVALARLTRASALVAGAEVERGAAVTAQTPEALARHKARAKSLAENPEFRALGMHGFLNIDALRLSGRLRDTSAVGFEIDPGLPLAIRGRALYRGHLFRSYLERYVQAPLQGPPQGAAPFRAALTEYFPRLWEEILHGLPALDREKVELEVRALERDFLERRPLSEFLANLGPSWGFSVAPVPEGLPTLVAWIDLPDDGTREILGKLIHRAVSDGAQARRDRGAGPLFELSAEGSVWRVKPGGLWAARLGESYTPAYRFEKNRFVFSTRASALEAPASSSGTSHIAVEVDRAAVFAQTEALVPLFADFEFQGEAERSAWVTYMRTFTPWILTALERRFPDPAERSKYLDGQRAQLEAKALEEISKTPRYREECERRRRAIAAWDERLRWIDRASASGRFTSDGFRFEVNVSASQKH